MSNPQLITPRASRRLSNFIRTLRVLWRDSLALWREFRIPIIALFITTIGGGGLYSELHYIARGERMSLLEIPYAMIELMTLQGIAEEPLPKEWYLIIFWYVLPLIGVYIVGRGALDFGRIFFNRGERRRAWEEAVASTYRNHIIVTGAGHVGMRVIRTLSEMGFEIVAVDIQTDPETEAELGKYNVPLIVADARTPTALESAGLRHAAALVVCTSNDQLNIEMTMRARDMNPRIRIIVRMWDTQFAEQLRNFMGVQAVLSASDLAAPSFAGAAVGIEITQTLTVHGVEYSMIRLQVEKGSFMEGQTIEHLQTSNVMDIVLHEAQGDVDIHPSGDIIVQAGDTVVLFAKYSQIVEIVARNRAGMQK